MTRIRGAWAAALLLAVGSRLWNALESPVLRGYDAWGHVSYALFLDLYRALPYADQGWSYFHPPLHYLFGFLLAQAGHAGVLVRGLALFGSAASLGTAGLAAWVVRRAVPARPLWAPLSFLAVAFLPVQVYTSPMPGNEQTAAFCASLAVALFAGNQLRAEPSRSRDVVTGLALGLALLAKFSGLLASLAVGAVLVREALAGDAARRRRALGRAALLGVVVLALAGPYYARNLLHFGTPFQLSRDTPLVSRVESSQGPQARELLDFVRVSPRTLLDPGIQKPHLLHSVWGTLYVHVWSDPRSDVAPPPGWSRVLPLWLGLGVSVLAGLGLARSARRAWRGSPLDSAMLALTVLNLGAFAVMAWRVPTWAILKASYLLQLSLPLALFLARGLEGLAERRGLLRLAVAWLLVSAGVGGLAHTPGVALPRGGENARMAAVHLYFGSYAEAARIAERELRLARGAHRAWLLELMAAARLGRGQPGTARDLYRQARDEPVEPWLPLEDRSSPWVTNRLAVATALAGDEADARALLDAAPAQGPTPPAMRVNLAALRARAGELDAAEAELREALRSEPDLVAGWADLAWVREQRGDAGGAAEARREAQRAARTAPRGFPYGVGDGFHLGGQRPLLLLDGDALRVYQPPRSRAQSRADG